MPHGLATYVAVMIFSGTYWMRIMNGLLGGELFSFIPVELSWGQAVLRLLALWAVGFLSFVCYVFSARLVVGGLGRQAERVHHR